MTSSLVLLVMTLFFALCLSEDRKFNSLSLKYHVSTDSQNWFQALINCKSAGMELASVPSETDHENLNAFLKRHGYDKGYWLSGTDLGDGVFTWVSTGNPVVFSRWLPNQPDNVKSAQNKMRGEHCIQWGMFERSSFNTSGWNDLFCGHKLPYICQETEYCNTI